jgi:hypothetical protein
MSGLTHVLLVFARGNQRNESEHCVRAVCLTSSGLDSPPERRFRQSAATAHTAGLQTF